MTGIHSQARRRWRWAAVLLILFSTSCSSSDDKLNPVRGKVVYQGKPLAGAMVSLHPKGNKDLKVAPSTGLTADDGTFTLTTSGKNGARAGEYVVTIICSEVPKSDKKSFSTRPPDAKDILKGAYAERDKSKINVTIKSGDNQLEPFVLK